MSHRTRIVIRGKQRLAGFRRGLKYAYIDGRATKRGNKYYVDAVRR
jgi:hypothetical protein